MTRLFPLFRRWNNVLAVGSGLAFIAALIAGVGLKSLAFLGAAAWWMLLSRYWAGKARDAKRHRELREKRLERERKGLAPPRG